MLNYLAMCSFLLLTFAQGSVFASEDVNPELMISQIKLIDLGEVDEADEIPVEEYVSEKGLGEVIVVVDQLIALGKKVWPIIEAGRPVVSSRLGAISVLPLSSRDGDASELQNWSAPRHRKYRLVYENVYGMDVVTFSFTVHYQYGGNLDGVGKYLTAVTVTANEIYVMWGFDFNAKSSLVKVTNRGTRANPVAGVTLEVSQVAKTVFTEVRRTDTFHISGDGRFVRY